MIRIRKEEAVPVQDLYGEGVFDLMGGDDDTESGG